MCRDSPEGLGYGLGQTKEPMVSPHIAGSGPATVPIVSVHTVGAGLAVVDFASTCTRWHHGKAQQLGTASRLDGLLAGVCSRSFHGGSTLAPLTLHHSLEPDLELTGPGRGLSQRQPRFQAAAQPPQFL